MRRILYPALVIGVVVAACRSGGTQLTARHREALVDSVRTFLSEYVQTVNSGDLSGVVPYYADDESFHWAEDGRLRYPSHASLVSAFDSLVGTIRNVNLVVDQPKIVPLMPGLAALTATYRQSVTDSSGQVLRFAGAFTTLLEHRGDGWKFRLGHASTNPEVR